MLSRANRLTKTKEIQGALRGYAMRRPGVMVRAVRREAGEKPKFAVVAGKRLSKKAAVRNLVKRRIRQAIRELLPKIPSGKAYVITALPGAETKTYAELKVAIQSIFEQIGRSS